jgi:hypothetical protein
MANFFFANWLTKPKNKFTLRHREYNLRSLLKCRNFTEIKRIYSFKIPESSGIPHGAMFILYYFIA